MDREDTGAAVQDERGHHGADRDQRRDHEQQRPGRDAALAAAGGPAGRRDHLSGALRLGEAGLELPAEVGHRREPVARVLRHRPLNGRLETRRHLWPPVANRRRRLVDVAHRDGDEVLTGERHLAREQLVEDDTERVDVRVLVHTLALRLLGRDVVGRPEHGPGLRHSVLHVERAGDAEVGHLRLAVAVQQDVLRLDVAVDEPLLVRERESLRDLDRELDRRRNRDGATPDRAASGSRRRRTRGR